MKEKNKKRKRNKKRKSKKKFSKLISTSGSKHYYIFFTKKTPKILSIRKFDPIFKKHFIYFEEK